ncbi:MAG TPA: glycosyl hydrolase [Verrucomicrobiae bacterium]
MTAALALCGCQTTRTAVHKPLYRDPIMDGASDPTVIWNGADKKWYMFYTSRRANVPGLGPGVAWVHGTPIGIATSDDGATWKYLRDANIIYPDAVADKTYWAPAVVEHNGLFHMYLVYVPGIFQDWDHPRYIIHLTSTNLIDWQYESTLPLAHPKVIDAGVLHLPDGTWRLWYKDEVTGSSCDYADSPDLYHWTDHGKVAGLSDRGGEAPVAFHWKDHYWLFRDIGHGLALYRSDDAANWMRVGTLLQDRGTGADDDGVGHHPDVILSSDRAYMFYFVQPRSGGGRRSSIQVVELKYDAAKNILTADRNHPTLIHLKPPTDLETESKFD